MSRKLTKKIASVGLAVSTVTWLSGASMVFAQTIDLSALLQQLQQIQNQINTLLQQQGGSVVSTPSTACNFTRNLTVGSRGEDVKCLQQYLNTAGFKVAESGPGSPGNETTYFGPATKAAVAKWQQANGVSPAAGYFGPLSRAKYSQLAASFETPTTPSQPGVVVPQSGLRVDVKALGDTTVGKNFNNVEVMNFTIVSGEDGVEVDELVFRRNGAGNRSDFDRLYLYRGSERLGSGRTINSNQEVVFSNLKIKLDKGDYVTLSLRATMAASVDAGSFHYFTLEKVNAGSGVVVSNLPATGRKLTVAGVSSGSLTHTLKTPVSAEVNIGDKNVEIYNSELTANSEDIELSRLILTQYGSVNISELDNMVVKVDGQEKEATVSVGSDKITIEFSSPVLIKKGETINLSLRADISAGAYIKGGTGTILISVDESDDVYGKGLDFGYGVSVTGDIGNPGSSFQVTLKTSDLVFTYEGPQASRIGLNDKGVVLFETKVAAASEYEIRKITFKFDLGAYTELKNVKIYNKTTGRTLAGPVEIASSTTPYYQTFSDTFELRTGVSNLQVLADIGSNTWSTSTIKVSLIVDHSNSSYDLVAKNLDTNETLDLAKVIPASDLVGRQLTVAKPDLIVAKSPLPASQTYVVGKTNTVIGAYILEASNVSDIDVRSLTFNISASSTATSTSFPVRDLMNAVDLYIGDPLKSVSENTQLGSKSLPSTGSNVSVQFDTSSKLKIEKDKKVTVFLVGSLKSSFNTSLLPVNVTTTLSSITAKDSNNKDPNFNGASAFATVNGNQYTVETAGAFSVVAFSADNPSKDMVITPGSNILFSSYRLRPVREDIKIKDIVLSVDSADNSPYFQNIQIWKKNDKKYAESVITGSTRKFENLDLILQKDKDSIVELRADLVDKNAGFGTQLESGQLLKFYIPTSTTGFDIRGVDSDISVTFPTSSISNPRTYQVAAGYPKFTVETPSSNNLAGTNNYTFKVKAQGGEVHLRKISFKVETLEASTTGDGDFYVSNFVLKRGTTQIATASTSASTTIGSSTITETGIVEFFIDEPSHYSISEGSEVTFTVTFSASNYSGSNDSETVKIIISNEDETGSYDKGNDLNDVSGRLIWSDTYMYFNGKYLEYPINSSEFVENSN